MERNLKTKDVMERFGVNRATVNDWVKAGWLEGDLEKREGDRTVCWYFSEADVQAAMERKVSPGRPKGITVERKITARLGQPPKIERCAKLFHPIFQEHGWEQVAPYQWRRDRYSLHLEEAYRASNGIPRVVNLFVRDYAEIATGKVIEMGEVDPKDDFLHPDTPFKQFIYTLLTEAEYA